MNNPASIFTYLGDVQSLRFADAECIRGVSTSVSKTEQSAMTTTQTSQTKTAQQCLLAVLFGL